MAGSEASMKQANIDAIKLGVELWNLENKNKQVAGDSTDIDIQ